MRLRNITPKSLFGRMLSIILVPIILVNKYVTSHKLKSKQDTRKNSLIKRKFHPDTTQNDLQQTKSICTGGEGGHPSHNGSLSLGLSNHHNNDRNSYDKFINFW